VTSKRRPQQTSRLLRVLLDAGVDFVLIGGVAAIVHGASRMTQDVDIAIAFSEASLSSLLEALRPFNPRHATRPELSLLDDPIEHLTEFRLLLIETELGRLDAMPEVKPLGKVEGLPYVQREVFERSCKVLTAQALIEVKQHVGRPKDLEVAIELEAALERDAGES
jgi:hypothetical protein